MRSASTSSSVGERADAEHAVFRLQRYVHAVGNVVCDQRRNADAEVHVEAVFKFLRGAFRHMVAGPGHCVVSLKSGGGAHGALLDALLVIAPTTIRSTKMPAVWI